MYTVHVCYSVFFHACSEGYEHSYVSAESSSSSESEFEPGWGGSKKRKKKKKSSQLQSSDYVRMTSRKRGVISYKESSGEESDSEQGEMEGEGGEGVIEVEDNRECIEKVLKKRRGKVGSKSVCEMKRESE